MAPLKNKTHCPKPHFGFHNIFFGTVNGLTSGTRVTLSSSRFEYQTRDHLSTTSGIYLSYSPSRSSWIWTKKSPINPITITKKKHYKTTHVFLSQTNLERCSSKDKCNHWRFKGYIWVNLIRIYQLCIFEVRFHKLETSGMSSAKDLPDSDGWDQL